MASATSKPIAVSAWATSAASLAGLASAGVFLYFALPMISATRLSAKLGASCISSATQTIESSRKNERFRIVEIA